MSAQRDRINQSRINAGLTPLPALEVEQLSAPIVSRIPAEVRPAVREAHTLSPNGYCRCGLTPTLTTAQHEQHLRSI